MTKKVPVQIGDGCAVTDDIVYVSAFPDALDEESRFTRLFAMNASTEDKWFHHDLDGHRVVSVCLRRAEPDRPRAVCALSDEGAVEIANSGAQVIEQIPGAGMEAGSRGLGPMRRIREIGKQLYACGAGNQVYVRRDAGWVPLDQQLISSAQQGTADVVDRLRSKQGSMSEDDLLALTESVGRVGGLDDIAGVADDDIYACGLSGVIWHWNGRHWRQIPSPTDDHLHSIHVSSGKTVWICGHNGTLLSGNKDRGFHSLIGVEASDHFWTVREFGKEVYLGCTKGLYSFDGKQLNEVRLPGHSRPPLIQSVDSTEASLWVIAERFVARLRQGAWERFDHPDNL